MNEDATEDAAQSVLIVDDHDLVRDLIARYLSASGSFAVSTASSIAQALAVIRSSRTFDVVLLDLSLPDTRGLEGLAEMIAANEDGKVVIFSGLASRATVSEAMSMGAVGYIPKDLPLKSLINAVNFVLSGEIFLPASYFAEKAAPSQVAAAGLTPKELVVLRGIRAGWMNKQIAHEMGLSEVTVKMHVRSICKKLGAKNRTHAAMIAGTLALD